MRQVLKNKAGKVEERLFQEWLLKFSEWKAINDLYLYLLDLVYL